MLHIILYEEFLLFSIKMNLWSAKNLHTKQNIFMNTL